MLVMRNITPPLRLPTFYLICLGVLNPSQQIQISESPVTPSFIKIKENDSFM